jgi:extracellular factor (EF) 3-hydroxypalmitic acid methyl ester biosynthesis protein
VYTQTQIDPMVSFRTTQGETARGTIVNVQRKSLVIEVYNPYAIIQVSEVLSGLAVRMGTKNVYDGKAVVINIVNTGLTALVAVTLIDEWLELSDTTMTAHTIGHEASAFVSDWTERFQIRPNYQIVVNEMRAFLSEVSRWLEQVDLSQSLPKEDGRLRGDFFYELAEPLIRKAKSYMDALELEAKLIEEPLIPVHRSFAQAALHPLLLRAPFVFRTYAKPLGYAGDYLMVKQILDDPRQGPNTYFQIVNAAFLRSAAAVAHRNRIDILVKFLYRLADEAQRAGRTYRVLNVGCGPAIEIQRFIETHPNPSLLSFELLDFSDETLAWTHGQIDEILARTGKNVSINYVHDSVHNLVKRQLDPQIDSASFDAVYCAGLFDYLSDKVCVKLLNHFVSRMRTGGTLLATNVHENNPEREFVMGHLLEWYLIYRDEAKMEALLPASTHSKTVYVDETGVNIFAEATVL